MHKWAGSGGWAGEKGLHPPSPVPSLPHVSFQVICFSAAVVETV